jgi:type I restriction enzyme R subunit
LRPSIERLPTSATIVSSEALPVSDTAVSSDGRPVSDTAASYMAEIIAKLNEVFGEDTTNEDQLVYVNHVLMGKLMESETLRQQAANNSKEQFGTSPDLRTQVVNAAMDAQDAHMNMSNKLLNSPEVLNGVLDILLNHSKRWEALRGSAGPAPSPR